MTKLTKHNYVDRDISWMNFNHRILEEAMRTDIPVLERVNYLGIYSNNLDEFFRVRMANLVRIASIDHEGKKDLKKEVDHALDLFKTINKMNTLFAKEYTEAVQQVSSDLKTAGIEILNEKDLDESQLNYVHQFYRENLMGRISPVWFENFYHFGNEADDRIYMITKLTIEKKTRYALFPLPVEVVGRWIRVTPPKDSKDSGRAYILYLDDLVRASIPLIFPGISLDKHEAWTFKFTRDAEMEIDNDLREGFLQKIQKGVKSRKEGVPVRLVYDEDMPDGALKRIKSQLSVNAKLDTIVEGGRYQNHKDFMSFPNCGIANLNYPKWESIRLSELHSEESIFDIIQEKDRLIHVPYHSFDGYIRLLNEAAIHPKVTSIKTTLYRLAKDSKVIRALICAALNGKKVTVIIELLARFDEASNINWAKKMQEAGINVIFGVEGLKVHSKITQISFSSKKNISVISSGNFHEGNASRYTDAILMTANQEIAKDVDHVFKFIEKPYTPIKFKHLLVSPNEMKKKLLALIDKEIKNHIHGEPSGIKIKINHITEPMMVQKIYEAATVGVKIDALVRGNCSLVDDEKFSGNLRVKGIIDRYLEHSRIFIFTNGGNPLYFIGSADWMSRNLDARIEVITPIYDKEIQKELELIIDYGLQDNQQGRVIMGDFDQTTSFRSQEELYNHYKVENK